MVRDRVHKAPLGELAKPIAERGNRNAAEAGQLVHGGQGRGARQQERVLKALAQAGGAGCRPIRSPVVGQPPLGRLPEPRFGNQRLPSGFQFLDAAAHAFQRRAGDGPPRVAPLQEPPEGVAGHAEVPGGTVASMPHSVGPHVGTDRPLKVRSSLRRAVHLCNSLFRDYQSTAPVAKTSQHPILNGKLVECNALQDVVLKAVLWYGRGRQRDVLSRR